MSYEDELQHLYKELMHTKTSYMNSEDALTKHALKKDIETLEFQIDVFKKAKTFDAICDAMDFHYPTEHDRKYLNTYQHPKMSLRDIDDIIKKYESRDKNE